MKWQQLLSTERSRQVQTGKASSGDLRSEFEKDYHRIIGSASFRRLQDKTQVFPLDQSDFIRTRLTHSLEVSSLGKSLGQNIGQHILSHRLDPDFTEQNKEDICNILQCAGLIHDIGNPPFGHFGENVIRDWFRRNLPELLFNGRPVEELLSLQMREDFYHFEGNAQALRLVTKLHYLVDEHGMNLTYALLNTIIKYPISSTEIPKVQRSGEQKKSGYAKMGYYLADQDTYRAIVSATGAGSLRHPLTYILEAADDIAYRTADIEDAFVKGFISYSQLKEELSLLPQDPDNPFHPLERLEKKYESGRLRKVSDPEEYAVKNWIIQVQGFLINCATYGFTRNYQAIMEGSYQEDIFKGTYGEKLIWLLGDVACRRVFDTETIYKMEAAESVIMDFLLKKLIDAVLYYDTDRGTGPVEKRLLALISENYKSAYLSQAKEKSEEEKLYLRLLLVTDYICGMTDSYAKRLYQELNGM